MNDSNQFSCYVVTKSETGELQRAIQPRSLDDLPAGDVVIRVCWSSLNYKDALAATAHPGVVRKLPHVPGIDAAGVVVSSNSDQVTEGQEVLVTGYELGAERWGGWSQYIRVPAEWVIPLPTNMNAQMAMQYGTAGFTAAQCLWEMEHHGVTPDSGEIVVSGSTGGVGSLAVALLAKLGYRVVAVTGKAEQHRWLKELGAARILDREELVDSTGRPLLTQRWAGAVDTVGGATLDGIIRAANVGGCVTCCGMVGGAELSSLTVYPFILRGVILAGVTSSLCPKERRLEIWRRLADDWRVEGIDSMCRVVPLPAIDGPIDEILRGQIHGRIVVQIE